jgi:hypothetical protein
VKTNIHYLVVLDGIYTSSLLRSTSDAWHHSGHTRSICYGDVTYKICIQKQKYIFTMSYIYSFCHLGIYVFISLQSMWFIALDRLSVIHCRNVMMFGHRDQETRAERMMPPWSNSSVPCSTCIKWSKLGFSVSRKEQIPTQLVGYLPLLCKTFTFSHYN